MLLVYVTVSRAHLSVKSILPAGQLERQ